MATFSPRKATKSKRYCSVPQCKTSATKQRDVSFHSFPKEGEQVLIENAFGVKELVDRRKHWIHVLRIGKAVTNTMHICSLHFVKSDYSLASYSSKSRHLKKTAIPRQNLPVVSSTVTRPTKSAVEGIKRKDRYLKRSMVAEMDQSGLVHHEEVCPAEGQSEAEGLLGLQAVDVATDTLSAAETLLLLSSPPPRPKEAEKTSKDVDVQVGCGMSNTRDVATQVTSGDFQTNIVNVITNERKLHIATGIPTFALLQAIVTMFTFLSPENNRHSMNNKTKVILTFMKLKLNFSYVVLSILFGGTAATCSNVIKSSIITLATIMHSVIHWPSKIEVMQNMPKCFAKYKKTRIVLDCTEVATYKSKCLKCRVMSYSFYKGGQTIKYLIGISPAGLITYLSPGYGSRASDKAIFLESDLISKLDCHVDDIMVDKGFLIKDICDQYGFGLICPPFLRKKKKFSREEALATSDIAKVRVHVERAIERVKRFKIASERMPWKLLPMSDAIMTILCGMANLSSPILGDEKF